MIRDRASRIARKLRKYRGIRPATHCPKSACKFQYHPDVFCPAKTYSSRYRRIARLPDYPKRACNSRYFSIQDQQYQGLTKSAICKKRLVIRKYYGKERWRITGHVPTLPHGKERWRITGHVPTLPHNKTWGLGTASPDTSRNVALLLSALGSQQQSFAFADTPRTLSSENHRDRAQETPDNFLDHPSRYASSFACLHMETPSLHSSDRGKRGGNCGQAER
jgi:hypothetical protein